VSPTGGRIRFINHQGKKILCVDLSKCSSKEVEKLARMVPDYVTVRPRGSVLILTDFAGASFDHDALRTMKESAVFDKPFVKKSALIGTETLPKEFYEQMKIFSRRELPSFATREEALAWLVEE
jgi:hypothetical protein